jgi:solute carrier family 34 (sodium-dependent phosphate cotransporter)
MKLFISFILLLSINVNAAQRKPIPMDQIAQELGLEEGGLGEEDLEIPPEVDEWLEENQESISQEQREDFIRKFSCGRVDPKSNSCVKKILYRFSGVNWKKVAISATVPATVWFFILNLKLLGSGFKLLGGKDSANMFDVVDNPFSGLMVGILATVLVQSSSTSTSIIISLVGAGEMSVKNAISMIMGANIGTTVTNTIVSHGHIKDSEEFGRAFSCATVHDLFNLLSVAVLFPIQWVTNFLEKMTLEMAKGRSACDSLTEDCSKWKGDPVSTMVSPVVKGIVSLNGKVIKAIATGSCQNTTLCDDPILKGGMLKEAGFSDKEAGITCTIVPIVGLSVCLIVLVKSLNYLVKGKAAKVLRNALDYNGYLSILIGCAFTVAVQSSSITTTTLTPLCATRLISLEQAFPLTLGANIGTCITGILTALVATSHPVEALQVALAHFSVNTLGIMIWYPVKSMRNVPIRGAKYLGEKAEQKRWFPLAYTAVVFVALPAIGYGISSAAQ